MSEATIMDETDQVPVAFSPSQSLAVGIARAEIDQQITTARAYPRSLKQVSDRVFSLATLDKESAEESMYALPRGGKPITGPSIRFAEIVKQAYGNCRAAARVVHVDRDEKFVEAEGIFHDLETNVATTARVRRRIVDSKGRLYSDDMIIVTGNAACSIALRNAIMGGVPKPLWRRAYEAVQATIKGDITTLTENRTKALQAFAIYGVKPEQVFAALDVRGAEDITVEHIPLLRSMFATLKNGEATVEEMFGAITAPGTAPQTLHAGFSDPKAEGRKARATKPKADPTPTNDPAKSDAASAEVSAALGGDDLPATVKGPTAEEIATANAALGAATEEVDTIAEGFPLADEVYHLDGDEWDAETGRRDTYKNGTPFSTATREAGHAIYADHEGVQGSEEKTAAVDNEGQDEEALPPEFAAFINNVEDARDFPAVKAALKTLQGGAYWKTVTDDQSNRIRCNTWETMVDNFAPEALPDPAKDVSAFRLWVEAEEDPDTIASTLSALENDPEFKPKPEPMKEQIRGAAAARIKALEP